MHSSGAGTTDKGLSRTNNEDVFLVDESSGLYIVSDGMGGHVAGEVAANAAVGAVEAELKQRHGALRRFRAGEGDSEVLERFVEELVSSAASRVHHMARENLNYHGMGCTLTLLLQAADRIAIAHVGDTRLYLCRNGEVHQLTKDHTLGRELADAGAIKPSEVKGSRYEHVLTRVLGPHEFVKVDTLSMGVIPGDRLLLCSDGLSNYLDSPNQLIPYMNVADRSATLQGLIDFAKQRGGADNITAVIVSIDGSAAEHATASKELELVFGAFDSDFVFQDLYLSQTAQIMNECRFETYRAGEVIIKEGEHNATLHIVASGEVSLSRTGREEVSFLGPGGVFGGSTLMRPRPCRATATALQPSTLMLIDRAAMMKLIKKDPWLGVAILERIATVLATVIDESYVRTAGHGTDANGNSLVGPNDLF